MAEAIYRIHGMDCAEEVSALKSELGPMSGVQDLAFDVLNAKMIVAYDDGLIDRQKLEAAVARTGMRAEPWRDAKEFRPGADAGGWRRWERAALTVASGTLTAIGFLVHSSAAGFRSAIDEGGGDHGVPLAARLLYLGAVVTGAWYVVPKGWIALRRFRPDMNLLMTIAVAGAIAIGEWFEAATVAFLFSLALVLESWSVGRARRAVAALMSLTPPRARVVAPDGTESEQGVEQVPVGSTIIVKPGEKIPLDGQVMNGETSVNQAPITGESVPVSKVPGATVFAGTINGDGAIEVKTTKPAEDTTLAHIIKLVSEAQSRRAPSEQWVEAFARRYTPAVMLLAILVLLVPPLFFGGAWSKWFYEALVLLVIACPCALVISTPVSIVAALASAARNGVLIKGGLHVESPSKLKVLALDKTGTLTEGRPRVQGVFPLSGHTERELIEVAAAIEARSEHPLARAVLEHAEAEGIRPAAAEAFQAIKGKGASAVVGGRLHWLGSHRYLEERGQETTEVHDRLEALASAGSTVVVIGNDEHVCGFLAIADRVRGNARASVTSLRSAGVERIVMLTGDNHGTAEAVARDTGVDEVRAELLPEDKVSAIEEMVARHGEHAVGMVGDGVNDAPAMARSSLGVAMGAAGTDAALETADIALMSDDLSRLPWLIRHSRRALTVIRQNIAASLGVKALFVVLTFLGKATLWTAVAADMGMTLLVVANALRLLTSAPGKQAAIASSEHEV